MFRLIIKNVEGAIRKAIITSAYNFWYEDDGRELKYMWDGEEHSYTTPDGWSVEVYYFANNIERLDTYIINGESLVLTQLLAEEKE